MAHSYYLPCGLFFEVSEVQPTIKRRCGISFETREFFSAKRGKYGREIPFSRKVIEVEQMGTGRIRIIKQGTASKTPESQSALVPGEKDVNDPIAELVCNISGWVTEFKERPRTDPRITFQALFKEV